MKIIKVLLCILLAISISGCQQSPNTTIKDGVAKAQNSGDKIMQNQANDESSVISNSNDKLKDSFTNLPKMVTKTYCGKEKTINYNATVNIDSFETKNLCSYKLINREVSDDILKKVSEVYFGDKSNELIYNDKLPGYILGDSTNLNSDYFILQKVKTRILLSGQYKNLCPYESNIYSINKDLNLNYTREMATLTCEEFAADIGLSDYVLDYVNAYGKTIGTPYYGVNLVMKKDGLPVVSNSSITRSSFYVVNEGIYTINCSLFDLEKMDAVSKIISLDSAISILESEIDKISIHYEKGSIFSDKLDEFENMKTFPICNITFEYVDRVNANKEHIVSPAWRFVIGDKENYIDRSKVLAVDAITGEVIF